LESNANGREIREFLGHCIQCPENKDLLAEGEGFELLSGFPKFLSINSLESQAEIES
jgi:hypothetical protein